MFTGNKIALQEFSGRFGLKVVRDCQLSYVGKIPTDLPDRIVPCASGEHVTSALSLKGVIGIITTDELAKSVPASHGLAVAQIPLKAALHLHEALVAMPDFHWKSFQTRISPTANIHPSAIIDDHDVVIGANTTIGAQAVVMAQSLIGENCVVGPGTIIGCDAFEVATQFEPNAIILQSGGVVIEDNVEILAKCTIAKATFGGFTKIGAQSKLDCHVHVAHDCQIGERVRIAASVGIYGRAKIDDNVFLGPRCSISNGIHVGANSKVSLGSVVTLDVAPGTTVTGNFAVPHEKWLAFVKSL